MEASEGVRLVMNAPYQTREKLVTADAPWESDAHLGVYSTVVQEGGKIRMWYDVRAGQREPGKNPPFMGLAYAESKNGLHFDKPALGLVERNGSKRNNLVFPTDPSLVAIGGGSVWVDGQPTHADALQVLVEVLPETGLGDCAVRIASGVRPMGCAGNWKSAW